MVRTNLNHGTVLQKTSALHPLCRPPVQEQLKRTITVKQTNRIIHWAIAIGMAIYLSYLAATSPFF